MSHFLKARLIPAIALVAMVAAPLTGVAESDISVSATVEPAVTTIGEPVRVSLTINGSQRVGQVPNLQIDGAQTQHIGASTQMRLVNTSLSVSLTHT